MRRTCCKRQTGFKQLRQLKLEVIRYFSLDTSVTSDEIGSDSVEVLTNKLFGEVKELYKRKTENAQKSVLPVLQNIYETRGDAVKVIAIPFADTKRGVNVYVDLEKFVKTKGKDLAASFEKAVTLSLIDEEWKHHLRAVDDLKQEVQLASYEQKDPLVIYKKEAFNLFSAMIGEVNREIASFLFKGQVPQADPQHVRNADQEKEKAFAKKIKEGRGDIATGGPQPPQQEVEKKLEPIRVEKKVGRNDPCPCGSGKKYKNCHGKEE